MSRVNYYTMAVNSLENRYQIIDLIIDIARDKSINNIEFTVIYAQALNRMKAL